MRSAIPAPSLLALALAVGSPALCSLGAPPARPAAPAAAVTLELIMQDKDWIGCPPESPYWADDGRSIYYFQKRRGEDRRDLIQVGLNGRDPRTIPDSELGAADQPRGDRSLDNRWKVYAREGDLFLKDLTAGTLRQLTRTAEAEVAPRFMIAPGAPSPGAGGAPDGSPPPSIWYRRAGTILIRQLDTGLEYQPADIILGKDPAEEKDKDDYLRLQQERLFEHVRQAKEKAKAARQRTVDERAADPARVPPPFYLGDDREVRESLLSPDGRWLALRLVKKGVDGGKSDQMPQYVTDSGYASSRSVRAKVGTGQRVGEELVLLDLTGHEKKTVDLSALPGIKIDPLKPLRDAAEAKKKITHADAADTERKGQEKSDSAGDKPAEARPVPEPANPAPPAPPPAPATPEEGPPRPVVVTDILFSWDAKRLAIQCLSTDNKDRWIAAVGLDAETAGTLTPLEHMTDEAWINMGFGQVGWLRDNSTLWFLSEETGYSHLFLRHVPDGARRQLTGLHESSATYEVSDVRLARDGAFVYFAANLPHPGVREFYRVPVGSEGGPVQQLTNLGGLNTAMLSPDERGVLLIHSTATSPPELFVQATDLLAADPAGRPEQITHTVSEAFAAVGWVRPRLVPVPSRDGRIIWSRLYEPPSAAPVDGSGGTARPAVLFIHGAGYLQDAHEGWSYYSHEFMFHTLLARRGCVVLDMDYRASAGYGRDWRTAIYRRMGTPELDDLEDGAAWLVKEQHADPARVGVYGGSYGGFLTLMALFTRPDLFACGAALRPVADWAHYSDGYTANILNTPQADPEAYERSSPIEFAAGLKRPLLICHGMQDDNVLFEDTVRLTQRLIELKKEHWQVAMYPVESHAFTEPTSWLDEYRRILDLFEQNLRPGP